MERGELVVARILHGGMVAQQGLLHVGDVIREVNGREVGSDPRALQESLRQASGSVVLKVLPSYQEPHPPRQVPHPQRLQLRTAASTYLPVPTSASRPASTSASTSVSSPACTSAPASWPASTSASASEPTSAFHLTTCPESTAAPTSASHPASIFAPAICIQHPAPYPWLRHVCVPMPTLSPCSHGHPCPCAPCPLFTCLISPYIP